MCYTCPDAQFALGDAYARATSHSSEGSAVTKALSGYLITLVGLYVVQFSALWPHSHRIKPGRELLQQLRFVTPRRPQGVFQLLQDRITTLNLIVVNAAYHALASMTKLGAAESDRASGRASQLDARKGRIERRTRVIVTHSTALQVQRTSTKLSLLLILGYAV